MDKGNILNTYKNEQQLYIPKSFICKARTNEIIEYSFLFETNSFEGLKRFYREKCNKLIEIYLKIENNSYKICKAYVGWQSGVKYPVDELTLESTDDLSHNNIEQIVKVVAEIVDGNRILLNKIIDEERKVVAARKIPYNPKNNTEKIMYEKYFGKEVDINPKISYVFHPNIELLYGIEEVAEQIKPFINPIVEIALYPKDETDWYDVKVFIRLEEYKSVCEFVEKADNEYISYENMTSYMKNWVEYICNQNCWLDLIKDAILNSDGIVVSSEVKKYIEEEI